MTFPRKKMPSFQELMAFEAVGRHGNFTAAAGELALTQSAVSKQVRQIEDTLGVVLFDRTKGRVTLTPPGERYLRTARRILREYAAETHAVVASAGSEETLHVAVLPTFASRWLVPRLPAFMRMHPSLTINLTTEPEPFDLAEKSVDAAIHYGAPTWPNAELVYLCRERIVAVASHDYAQCHDLSRGIDVRRAELLQLSSRPTLWQDWFSAIGIEHPHPFQGSVFDQFAMTCEAALAGMGVALIPTYLVERELRSGALVALNENLSLAQELITSLCLYGLSIARWSRIS